MLSFDLIMFYKKLYKM